MSLGLVVCLCSYYNFSFQLGTIRVQCICIYLKEIKHNSLLSGFRNYELNFYFPTQNVKLDHANGKCWPCYLMSCRKFFIIFFFFYFCLLCIHCSPKFTTEIVVILWICLPSITAVRGEPREWMLYSLTGSVQGQIDLN